ncbi:hypothetical protein Acsp04_27780 [Actinomadura sp. NBRC 104425]|nr:hypothetical protein Acsp04_27780 [Actinomadura sp. NBRC 104425]
MRARAKPVADTGAHDPPFDPPGRAPEAGVRTARRGAHARYALSPVPVGPAFGGGGRDLESFGGPPQRPAFVHDAAGQA